MGLNGIMAAIAAKSVGELTYADVRGACIYQVRIDFDPVGTR